MILNEGTPPLDAHWSPLTQLRSLPPHWLLCPHVSTECGRWANRSLADAWMAFRLKPPANFAFRLRRPQRALRSELQRSRNVAIATPVEASPAARGLDDESAASSFAEAKVRCFSEPP
eukprot:scaffold7359_cov255-Pinguiococcus_pyrenoidosus.AAC.11